VPERIVRLFKAVARSMAIELAPYGIQLNAIAPGCIEADLTREFIRDAPGRRWLFSLLSRQTCLGLGE
jgi:NAD(P)-dependent dehydrogenase (short-subunit alcohol dehydrogenase family)